MSGAIPKSLPARKLRCAVYTRKSSEEGLEQEFNSLHAQREACEAYIASQRAEGWLLVDDRYDDGGVSGGTLERPALKRLLADIEASKVDIIVVYKIDRLSRALMDFAKLVEVFDRQSVTFVSVTQSFNTTTSMGRLTLNILLSFAQFEREVIGERIRDKFAASRKKGIWMGGYVPMGYRVESRKLVIDEPEAELVREIFERFAELGSGTKLVRELAEKNARNRYGRLIDKGAIYKLINNRVYIGDAVHKGTAYPGEHKAIISSELWDRVHDILKESPRKRAVRTRVQSPALLKGLIFGPGGIPMTPTHTRKGGKLYRYYIIASELRSGISSGGPVRRIPAAEIEAAVVSQIKTMVRSPEIVVGTWRAARKAIPGITERSVRDYLQQFDQIWNELFPVEQARIVQLLVARIDVGDTGADITLKTDGLGSLIEHLGSASERTRGGGVTDRSHQTLTVHVPLKLTIRGGRKTIVAGTSDSPAASYRRDEPTINALAKAFRWRALIESGNYSSITELAKDKSINESYACRLLRMTLLAPDIVRSVLDGRKDAPLLTDLMQPVSTNWNEQKLAFVQDGKPGCTTVR